MKVMSFQNESDVILRQVYLPKNLLLVSLLSLRYPAADISEDFFGHGLFYVGVL